MLETEHKKYKQKQKRKERKPTILVLTLFSFVFDLIFFSPPPSPLLATTHPPPPFLLHPFLRSNILSLSPFVLHFKRMQNYIWSLIFLMVVNYSIIFQQVDVLMLSVLNFMLLKLLLAWAIYTT